MGRTFNMAIGDKQMKTYIEKNYGADADGNRGTTMVEFEVEKSDHDDIVEQLNEMFEGWDYDDIPDEANVILYSRELSEDVAIMVDVRDYLL